MTRLPGKIAVSIMTAVSIAYGSDSLNVRFAGNWPFGPTYALAYDSARHVGFCGSGGGVYVLDCLDPGSPYELADIRTRGFIRSLFPEE